MEKFSEGREMKITNEKPSRYTQLFCHTSLDCNDLVIFYVYFS